MTTGYASPVGGVKISGSADVSFTSGVGDIQVDSNVRVLWDLDNDGDFSEGIEDITEWVMNAEITTGRDFPSSLTGKAGPGKCRLSLNNEENLFSIYNATVPTNTDPFSTKVGRKLQLRVTDYDGVYPKTISYVGIGAIAVGNNTSVVPAFPTGLERGDLMILVAAIRNSGTGTVVGPAGWYPMKISGNLAVYGRYYEDGERTALAGVADEAAPTVTFANGAANATTQAQILALRGTDKLLSRVVVNSIDQLNGSAQNIAVPGLVAAATDTLADPDLVTMVVIGWKQDDWTSVAELSGQLFTEISDSPTTTGDDAGIEIQYRIGGGVGFDTFTGTSLVVTGGANAISRAIVLALAPEPDPTEPNLLARDRFNRHDNSTLGADELGTPWVVRSNGGFGINMEKAIVPVPLFGANVNVPIMHTVNVGQFDMYVQGSFPNNAQYMNVGLLARWTDSNNYTRLDLNYFLGVGYVAIWDVTAGVPTNLGFYSQEGLWDEITIGILIKNQEATAFIGGVPAITVKLSGTVDGIHAGIYGLYFEESDRRPAVDDFHVWDDIVRDDPSAVWTGWITEVKPEVQAGPYRVCEVNAEGQLGKLAVADIASPRIPYDHTAPGFIVGDIYARAGLLHPPYTLQAGARDFGPHGRPDEKAITQARFVELAERGFVYETPEGYLGFQDGAHRDTVSTSAWFTDVAGRGQYGYSSISIGDHQNRIFNRVTASTAPSAPTVQSIDTTQSGFNSDVTITLPSVNDGDLVLVTISQSIISATNYLDLAGWTNHRSAGTDPGVRIYSKICSSDDSGDSVTFFDNTGETSNWLTCIYRISNWWGDPQGIILGDISTGLYAGSVSTNWERDASLFMWFQSCIASPVGLASSLIPITPKSYPYDNGDSRILPGSFLGVAYDLAITTFWKVDCTEFDYPGLARGAAQNETLLETFIIGVRGYNGSNRRSNFEGGRGIGGEGFYVTVTDVESQADHNFIRSNPDIPYLADAPQDAKDWALDVLNEFSTDRPIITMSFYASKSAALRLQAIERRVSDRVHITAASDGNSGLGIDFDFHIEAISMKFSQGIKLWEVKWDLSAVA